jgi:4-hydroxyphenylpyruvate dioxygenase
LYQPSIHSKTAILASAQLSAIAEQAALRGLLVAYEALSWGGHVRTFDHAWRIVEQASHPALGLVLDSFHTLVRPEDWSAIRDLPGDRIFFVQLSDAPRIDVDYMTLRRNHSTLPGRGMLKIPDSTAAVLATGYQGPLSVEVFNLVDRTPAIQMAKEAFVALLKLQP